ncbi:MAG: DNA primase [Chromatiales bacterium]|nr:DNA primase [Chromatiales bacterium]
MAGRIPKTFIDDLIARVDVVQVVGEYLTLKKRGADHWAPCPFHNENTPSFKVSGQRQTYHCFGCGAHGTAVGFLMEYSGLAYPEAIEHLADGLGLEVPREGGSGPHEDFAPALDMLARANEWYQSQLRHHTAREEAVAYLKNRGLSGQIAKRFELGLAPPGRGHLVSELGGGETAKAALTTAGLVVERVPGQLNDRFWNRIMFPIHNRRGQVIGFGARTLGDGNPKYLNSPETPLFVKGRELYGLFQARHANRKLDYLVVVEGYMDVVALAQFGISNAVATLGTAATGDHVERLFQSTGRVVFCFDGDKAGRQAAGRALENALPHLRDGRSVGFVFLPEGEDPDTLVRSEGPDEFDALVRDAQPLSDVLFQRLTQDIDLSTMEGRAKLYRDARPLLDELPPGAFREMAQARLGELADLSSNQMDGLADASPRPARGEKTPQRAGRNGDGRRAPSLTRTAIKLLLHHPPLAGEVLDISVFAPLDMPGATLLYEMLELLGHRPDLSMAAVIEHFRDHPEGQHLARLVDEDEPLLRDGLADELQGALNGLLRAHREERRRSLARKLAETGLSEDEKSEYLTLTAGDAQSH